jgi:hypothetical protein
VYAGIDTGYMMRLENGNTWDGTGIEQVLETGDFLPMTGMHHTRMRWLRVFSKKLTEDVDLTINHYSDTGTNADRTMIMPLDSGNRVTWTTEELNERALFHRMKYSATTSTTTGGVQLYGWSYLFQDDGFRH